MKKKLLLLSLLLLFTFMFAESRFDMKPSELLLGHWQYDSHFKDSIQNIHVYYYENNFNQYIVNVSDIASERNYKVLEESNNPKSITISHLFDISGRSIGLDYQFIFSEDGKTASVKYLDSASGKLPNLYNFINDEIVDKSQTFNSISGLNKITNNRKSLNGLLNIDWGTSKLQAKQLFLERNGVSFYEEENNTLIFKDGTLAGYEVGLWILYFTSDKFCEGRAGINVDLSANSIPKYNEIKTLLVKKYGLPDVDVEEYKYPYEKDDGHEETAIKIGKCEIGATWILDSTTITLMISTDLNLILSYSSNELNKIAKKEAQEEKLDDF